MLTIDASGGGVTLSRLSKSYGEVQAGRTALRGGGWPAEGWIVIAAWTAVLVPITVLVFRRDTGRA
jgi:hypothetical protein